MIYYTGDVIMTKLRVYGAAMTLAENPWADTPYGKKATYLRTPVPWDKRRRGLKALSDKQRSRIEAFTRVAQAASNACPKTGRMSTNLCRVKYISDHLRER